MVRLCCVVIGWLGFVFLVVGCGAPPASQGCLRDAECPQGAYCEVSRVDGEPRGVCIKVVAKAALGSACKLDEDCATTFCFQPNKEPAYCTKNCTATSECSASMTCKEVSKGLKICVRESILDLPDKGCECGKEGASCVLHGHSDCDRQAGYYCLSSGSNDPNARCVKSCNPSPPNGQSDGCAEGFVCTTSVNGQPLCVKSPFTKGDMGANCSKAGQAQCKDAFFCYSRYPRDVEAFCTQGCNPYDPEGCGKGFVCESPREEDPYICIPQGSKPLGADCKQRLFLECQSGVCVSPTRQRSEYFCSQACNASNDTCPVGFKCTVIGYLYRSFCLKSEGRGLGEHCNRFGDAECKSKVCVLPKPGSINKVCSQTCDANTPCPTGWECDTAKKACVPKTGNKKIGEECKGTEECITGTCVLDNANKQFCSQVCTGDSQCPEGFQCRYLGFTQRYCLPKLAGGNKVGEPCPNGSGDCASGYCLTDIVNGSTFCTEPCGPRNPQSQCPSPLVCTKVSEQESYCTPKGFSPP